MTAVSANPNALRGHSAPETQSDVVAAGVTRSQILSKLGLLLMAVLVVGAGLLHAENMFAYPYFDDAEGTSMANAWAVTELGDLSPYTYAYENPPLGSLALAAWDVVAGGADSFGFELNSGRVLMMILHMISAGFVFGIAHRISGNYLAAAAALIIFALSPLATGLQRRVLMDNLMLVPLLMAFYLVVGDRRTLFHYIFSALAFGLAVLIKTDAFYMFPALVLIARMAHPHHRRFATLLWVFLALFVSSLYPLYAHMRLELFPQGWLLGGDFPHVSLWERLVDRGAETGTFLNIGAGLPYALDQWTNIVNINADPILIGAGALSCAFLFMVGGSNRYLRQVPIAVLSYSIGLLIGGQIFVVDILPILPFFAVATGITLVILASFLVGFLKGPLKWGVALVLLGVMMYPFWVFYGSRVELYTMDQVQGQLAAVEWVQTSLPEDATIITDNFAFVSLREQMPNVHHYWKVDTDPDVKFTLLNDDICNVDYLLTSPQVLNDISTFGLDLVRRAQESSELLLTYENNGWPIQVWQVSKQFCFDQDDPVEAEIELGF